MNAKWISGIFLLVSALLVGNISFAEEKASTATATAAPTASPGSTSTTEPFSVGGTNYVLCKNGKAVRTIRIEKKGNLCRALYTKEGVDQVVGKSGADETCLKVANRIKGNLEAGDWKCKDVSQSRVSSSME